MKVCGAVWGVVLAAGVCAAQEGYTPLGEEPYEGQLPHEGETWQGFSVEVPEGAERLVVEVEGEGVALFVKEGEPIQSSWVEEATASSLEGGGRERVVLESSREPVLRACAYFVGVVLLDPEAPAKFRVVVEVQRGGVGEGSQPLGGQGLSQAEVERVNGRLVALYQQGRLNEASRLAESLFRRVRAAFGGQHPDTLTSLNNLALLYKVQGRYAEAEPLLEECLEIRREVLGERHPDTLTSLNNLAALYRAQGRYGEAEPLYWECLEGFREVLGERHPSTLGVLNNLAFLYKAQGRYAEAEPLLEECLEIRREVLGERHPDTLTSLSNLGSLYEAQGRYGEAEPLYWECLEGFREVLGERHPNMLASLNNLALLYKVQGRYAEAEPLLEECLEVCREVLGEGHPNTLGVLSNLAALYEAQGRYGEAEPLYWERLEVCREVLGGGHPDTLGSLNNLAALYQAQGRYAEAEPLCRECLEVRREVLGEGHPNTLGSLNNLALLYQAQGRYGEAESLSRQCLEIRREVLGGGHPNTLESLNNLALLYQAQGRYGEAESLYLQCIEISREVLGEGHPDTLRSLNSMAVLYEAQGRCGEAEPLWEWSLVESAGWLDENLAGAHPDARAHWAEERVKVFLPLLLSRAKDAATPSGLSFRAAAYTNGLVSRVARQVEGLARLQQGDSEVARLAQRLAEARRRLAQASLQQVSGTSGQDPDVVLLRVERLRRLQAEAEGLAQELGRATSAFRPYDLRHVPSLEELTAPLPPQGARVQLVRFTPRDLRSHEFQPARYAALVLRKDGSRAVVDLGLAEELEEDVGRYRAILLDPLTSAADLDLEESARGLHELLWAPLEEALEGVEEVFLIADGALHLLPFEALLDEDYLYLGERLRITRAEPGAEERVDLERVAVVGNPAFGEGAYGELPGAQLEGEALVAVLSETKAKVDWLSGAAATRERVQEALGRRPQIVHLATHGFFHPYEGPEIRWDSERVVIPEGIDPLVRCGLVFAGVNEGRAGSQWTASEVLGLDLEGVELVVLSACQTGVGEVVDGEGVNCLGSAFLYAGADHVLTTLWPVDDEQTRAFVQEFYERYLEGASAEEALRATKLAFLEDAEQPVRAHPRHWAGFVLLGQ